METKVYTLSGEAHPTAEDITKIKEAAGFLVRGGIVAFPTETVYGLGADARRSDAAKKVYAAKGRPSDNPLIVHIAEMERLSELAADIPDSARKLADAFWPGPLTMIFQKTALIPDETTGGLPTVAVRMPSDETALCFIREAGGFVAAPSANVSGRPSPTTGAHVLEDLNGRVDAVLLSHAADIGIESTIVDLTGEVPELLRPGFVTPEDLKKVLPALRIDPAVMEATKDARPKAPGMKYRHYAPKAPLTIISGADEAVVSYINRKISEAKEKGSRVGILASEGLAGQYHGGVVKVLNTQDDALREAAHGLYAALRAFDEEKVDVIYAERFDGGGMGFALMNRLEKAAGHQVIEV